MTHISPPKLDSEDEFDKLDLPEMAQVDAAASAAQGQSPSSGPKVEQAYGLRDYKLLTPTAKSTVDILDMQGRCRDRGSAPPMTPMRNLGPPGLLQAVLSTDTTRFTPAPQREPSQVHTSSPA